jgi:DNA-binding transcriptional ArsR family regulator
MKGNQMSKEKRDTLSAVLLAMGDPTRREILEKVSQGEPSVLEIAESFSISLPAISKHLKVLERAGLIYRKREGRVHRFRLNARPMKDASEWIRNYERFWQVRLDSLEAYLEKTKKEGKKSWKKDTRRKVTL